MRSAIRDASASGIEIGATTMRVWELQKFGLEGLVETERPKPQPGPNQVVVRIGAVSLNYRDALVVDGTYFPDLPLPFVPLSDAAGQVVAVGVEVRRFRVGDRVVSQFIPEWIDGDGTGEGAYATTGAPLPGVLAEYVVCDEQALVATPAYLSDEEASTLPIAALTAWNALFGRRVLKPGETVLIQGTGAVSVFALQLAAAAGARVIVTSSSDEKLERARNLGASDGINYARHPDWEQQVLQLTGGRGVDHVVEVVGGTNVSRTIASLARGGHVALIGGLQGFGTEFDFLPFLFKRATINGVSVGSRRHFESMNRALEKIQIRPVIDAVYQWSAATAALEHVRRGAFGKVVLRRPA
jgi:NADPH:quinone reductase-like Zn-dependent oxidoreductase